MQSLGRKTASSPEAQPLAGWEDTVTTESADPGTFYPGTPSRWRCGVERGESGRGQGTLRTGRAITPDHEPGT